MPLPFPVPHISLWFPPSLSLPPELPLFLRLLEALLNCDWVISISPQDATQQCLISLLGENHRNSFSRSPPPPQCNQVWAYKVAQRCCVVISGGREAKLWVDAPTAGICLSSFRPRFTLTNTRWHTQTHTHPTQSHNEAVQWGQLHSSEAKLTTVISLALLPNWSGGGTGPIVHSDWVLSPWTPATLQSALHRYIRVHLGLI